MPTGRSSRKSHYVEIIPTTGGGELGVRVPRDAANQIEVWLKSLDRPPKVPKARLGPDQARQLAGLILRAVATSADPGFGQRVRSEAAALRTNRSRAVALRPRRSRGFYPFYCMNLNALHYLARTYHAEVEPRVWRCLECGSQRRFA